MPIDRETDAPQCGGMAKAKRTRVKGYVATRPEQVPGDLMHPARQAEMAAAMENAQSDQGLTLLLSR